MKAIWNEAKLVTSSLQIEVILLRDSSTNARVKGVHDEDTPDEIFNEMNEADKPDEEAHFRKHIFYVVLGDAIGGPTVSFSAAGNAIGGPTVSFSAAGNAIGGPTASFSAAKQIFNTFSILWNYQQMSKEKLKRKAAELVGKYSEDISSECLEQEMNRITLVHNANCGRKQLGTLELLNALTEY